MLYKLMVAIPPCFGTRGSIMDTWFRRSEGQDGEDHTADSGKEGQIKTLLELRKSSKNPPELSLADVQALRRALEWLTPEDISLLSGCQIEVMLFEVLSSENFIPPRSDLAYQLRLSRVITCLTKARPHVPAAEDFAEEK